MLFSNDFKVCECGCKRFREETTFQIQETAKRNTKNVPLRKLDIQYSYYCTKCGKELIMNENNKR